MATMAQLARPNTMRFCTRQLDNGTAPKEVYNAIEEELGTTETIACIQELNNNWYNVSFDNEKDCDKMVGRGMLLQNSLIHCERANILNSSVVVYVKCPYEMNDQAVYNALFQYGTVTNVRRQYHEFDKKIETGSRSFLIKGIKKPIPSFLRVRGFNLPVRYRGQKKTCKICEKTDHLARECPSRGRCFVCGSQDHQAMWHDDDRINEGRDTNSVEINEEREEGERATGSEEEETRREENDDGEQEKEKNSQTSQTRQQQQQQQQHQMEKNAQTSETKQQQQQQQQQQHHQMEKKSQTSVTKQRQQQEHPMEKDAQTSETKQQQQHRSKSPQKNTRKKLYTEAVTNRRKSMGDKPKQIGFWDESVTNESRKRKGSDGSDDSRRKLVKDTENMQTEDVPLSEIEYMPSGADQSSEDDEEWVPYTRKGIQRFRKKRASGATAPPTTQPISTPENSKSTKPRGRGRGQKAM